MFDVQNIYQFFIKQSNSECFCLNVLEVMYIIVFLLEVWFFFEVLILQKGPKTLAAKGLPNIPIFQDEVLKVLVTKVLCMFYRQKPSLKLNQHW